MRADREEPDYLVGAQLAINPDSFVQVVKEAFLLEYNCSEHQEIAAVLGVSKGRISQIFTAYKTLKPESIVALLKPLKSSRHRRRILRAWNLECFGIDIDKPGSTEVVGRATTTKTLARIDRMIRSWRLVEAVLLALNASRKTSDHLMLEQIDDRLYHCYQRLDWPARAMDVALRIAERANKRGEPRRLAVAHSMRLRVLLGLSDSKSADLEPIFQTIGRLIEGQAPVPSDPPPYVLARGEYLRLLRLSAHLTLAEHGTIAADADYLEEELAHTLKALGQKKLKYQARFLLHQRATRIYALLGNRFAALEHLQLSYESGGLANLNAMEMCGLLQARIAQSDEPEDKVVEMYRAVIRECSETSDHYHRRLAESDLARLLAGQFTDLA